MSLVKKNQYNCWGPRIKGINLYESTNFKDNGKCLTFIFFYVDYILNYLYSRLNFEKIYTAPTVFPQIC